MPHRFFFVMGGAAVVILGLLAVAQVAVKKPKSKFAELSRPAQITELDLRLLEIRVSELESTLGTELRGGSTCCAHYWYDPAKDKIIANLTIGREEASQASSDQTRQKLKEAGEMIVARAASEFIVSSRVDAKADDFEIQFVTWNKTCFYVFAVYRLGDVELKDSAKAPCLGQG